MLSTAAPIAEYQTYAAVATTIATATTYQTAAPYAPPILAVVAQGRAPAEGDMGARPIYSILCHWCLIGTMTIHIINIFLRSKTIGKNIGYIHSIIEI